LTNLIKCGKIVYNIKSTKRRENMSFVNLQDVLKKELKPNLRSQIVPAIQMAYALAHEHIEQFDFLKWEVGQNIHKEFRGILVQYYFKYLIDNFKLNLNYEVAPNVRGNCHHIKLLTNKLAITISQVEQPHALPRQCMFRTMYSASNQLRLDFFDEDINNLDKIPNFYLLLTHGSKSNKPEFINIGFPSPGVRRWEYVVDLLAEPYQTEIPLNIPKYDVEEIVPKLKDFILKDLKGDKLNET